MTTSLSKIWVNADGCAEQYRCASSLCLMSVMSQYYSIINDPGISAPGNGKKVVDGINDVDKAIYIYQLMSTSQLPGSIRIDSQIIMNTGIKKYDVILAKEFQELLSKEHRKDGAIDQGK